MKTCQEKTCDNEIKDSEKTHCSEHEHISIKKSVSSSNKETTKSTTVFRGHYMEGNTFGNNTDTSYKTVTNYATQPKSSEGLIAEIENKYSFDNDTCCYRKKLTRRKLLKRKWSTN